MNEVFGLPKNVDSGKKSFEKKEIFDQLLAEIRDIGTTFFSNDYDFYVSKALEKYAQYAPFPKEIADEIVNSEHEWVLAGHLEKFENINHAKLAEEMLKDESLHRILAMHINRFSGIDKNLVLKKILENYHKNRSELFPLLKNFAPINAENAKKIAEWSIDDAGQSLPLFKDLPLDFAQFLIKNRYLKNVLKHPEVFTDLSECFVDGSIAVESVAVPEMSNDILRIQNTDISLSKFRNLDTRVVKKIREAGLTYTILQALPSFRDGAVSEEEIVDELLQNGYFDAICAYMHNLKKVKPKEIEKKIAEAGRPDVLLDYHSVFPELDLIKVSKECLQQRKLQSLFKNIFFIDPSLLPEVQRIALEEGEYVSLLDYRQFFPSIPLQEIGVGLLKEKQFNAIFNNFKILREVIDEEMLFDAMYENKQYTLLAKHRNLFEKIPNERWDDVEYKMKFTGI